MIGTALHDTDHWLISPSDSVEYSIFACSSGEPLDALELHVLARAYHAAWRARFARDPVGRHALVSLGVAIVFTARNQGRDVDCRSSKTC